MAFLGHQRRSSDRLSHPLGGLEPKVRHDDIWAMSKMTLMTRFLTFRNELATLWRAFLAPETPIHLKALMLLVPAYLLSPIDLVPDFIPLLGWVDDLVIVPMLVSFLVRMVPQPVRAEARRPRNGETVIDGSYRRR